MHSCGHNDNSVRMEVGTAIEVHTFKVTFWEMGVWHYRDYAGGFGDIGRC